MEVANETTRNDGKRPPIWVFLLAFVVIFIFLMIIARSMFNGDTDSISIGSKAPEFELTTFNGQTLNTADLSGNIVLVNFWASWCTPCQQEAEDLEKAWQNYKDSGEVIFVGVDYVDTEQEAMAYLDEFNVTYPNGPDLQSKISNLYRIHGVPETFIIDKSGRLARIKIGPFSSYAEIQSILNDVIASENEN